MDARRRPVAAAAAAAAILLAVAATAFAATPPAPRLSAAAAESIALRAAAGHLSAIGISGPSSLSVESARLRRVGRRLVWTVIVRTPSFRPTAPIVCRPGRYAYCISSFLAYDALSVLVARGTGAVLAVTPVRSPAVPGCKRGQVSTLATPCSTA